MAIMVRHGVNCSPLSDLIGHRRFSHAGSSGSTAGPSTMSENGQRLSARCDMVCHESCLWTEFSQGPVMMLSTEQCDHARLARDARFDGRFVTGVLTTGIYCRPICPLKPAKSSNVRFFASAAAAERAGFRPCLRCRPETAPGTPAWHGSGATVSRGLTLINGGFLDEHSVEELADVLGIGARHLTRLFMQHIGAPPGVLGRTRRVQIAKQLLDETDMAMTEIAFVAGFSSVRRFNAAFKDTYGRPPSRCGRAAGGRSVDGHPVTLQLAYRPPFNWALLATLLAAEATPGVEAASDDEYRRTIACDQATGWLSVRPVPGQNRLRLSLQLPKYAWLRHIIERVRTMFDLGANPVQIGCHLGRQSQLASMVRQAPGLRLPGAWDGFEVAVRVLVARDVGQASASMLMGRLAATYGRPLAMPEDKHLTTLFPTAAALLQAPLSGLGLSHLAAGRIHRLARAVIGGAIRFDPTVAVDDLVRSLTREAALDRPSAQWVAMRTLGDPDTTPFGAPSIPTPTPSPWTDCSEQDACRPWRSYAAVLLALPSAARIDGV
jgi:AraC family transcriptional regulator, regulatory protein of adaptative response / DNA-3-methyladenine glycosylase II